MPIYRKLTQRNGVPSPVMNISSELVEFKVIWRVDEAFFGEFIDIFRIH